jgi:cyclohexadienyl dehydratase
VLRTALLALLCLACAAKAVPERPLLRVGTSGDYAPFSLRDGAGRRSGFDVELARAYARERGLRVRWVPLRWATLERDFAAGRFDVVMSGITVRPERSLTGRFSVPVTTSGAVLLARSKALDPRARIAVNAGGHLERVARRLFPAARIEPLAPNAAVREALVKGAADAALTDTLEAPHWLAGTRGLHTLGPYTRDWKAYWLPVSARERALDLDAWLLAREADGTLAALRSRHLPPVGQVSIAAPLMALAAVIEERLSLMPLVAEAKRAQGAAVRDPAQESAVLAAASEAMSAAAGRAGLPAPDAAATRGLFQALIDAAREVQDHTLASEPRAAKPPDLDAGLRPALARISERIAELAVRLPADLEPDAVRAAITPISIPGLSAASRDGIANALVMLARSPRESSRPTRPPAPRSPPPRSRSRSSRGREGCRRPPVPPDARRLPA